MSADEERLHPPTNHDVGQQDVAVDGEASAPPSRHGEDPESRRQTGREPLENVEATLDKIDENPQIEGT